MPFDVSATRAMLFSLFFRAAIFRRLYFMLDYLMAAAV